jgi:hypothetical protein
MALYDKRTFKWKGDWWTAEIHGGSGAGWTERPTITSEMTLFTSITQEEANSRVAHITAGRLNKLSHKAIGSVLDAAKDFGARWEMSPFNAPNAAELARSRRFVDSDGLTWVAEDTTVIAATREGPMARPGVHLICLEDSALQAIVPLDGFATLDELVASSEHQIVQEIIRRVHDRLETPRVVRNSL